MADNDVEEQDNFVAEFAVMDLTPVKGHTYAVSIATGDPKQVRFLCTTLHGPYNFVEMVQEVGEMWVNHQHHAKVVIMEKDSSKPVKCLDPNTIDYIEAHYVDILMEETLTGAFDENKQYTHVAGTVEDQGEKPTP